MMRHPTEPVREESILPTGRRVELQYSSRFFPDNHGYNILNLKIHGGAAGLTTLCFVSPTFTIVFSGFGFYLLDFVVF